MLEDIVICGEPSHAIRYEGSVHHSSVIFMLHVSDSVYNFCLNGALELDTWKKMYPEKTASQILAEAVTPRFVLAVMSAKGEFDGAWVQLSDRQGRITHIKRFYTEDGKDSPVRYYGAGTKQVEGAYGVRNVDVSASGEKDKQVTYYYLPEAAVAKVIADLQLSAIPPICSFPEWQGVPYTGLPELTRLGVYFVGGIRCLSRLILARYCNGKNGGKAYVKEFTVEGDYADAREHKHYWDSRPSTILKELSAVFPLTQAMATLYTGLSEDACFVTDVATTNVPQIFLTDDERTFRLFG